MIDYETKTALYKVIMRNELDGKSGIPGEIIVDIFDRALSDAFDTLSSLREHADKVNEEAAQSQGDEDGGDAD